MKELLISKRCANSKTKSSVTEWKKKKKKTNEDKFMLKKKKKHPHWATLKITGIPILYPERINIHSSFPV